MITLRRANERGHAKHTWLDTYHTFSFSSYHDPRHMGFRALRVINEDTIAPGRGFPTHPHENMEIVTYVLSGGLAHKDSMGNGSVLRAGSLQRMSAGTGVTHSEFNASQDEPVHLYQIWILPNQDGVAPSYEEWTPAATRTSGQWQVVASPDARSGSMRIHQDASIHLAALRAGEEVSYTLEPGRHAWVQVTRGILNLNDIELEQGDGAAVSNEDGMRISGATDSEVMLFDLA